MQHTPGSCPHAQPRRLRASGLFLLSLLLFLLTPLVHGGDGHEKRTHFQGAHPISSQYGKGYCYIQVPHVHAYKPEQPALYKEVDHGLLFVGDPVPFGYEGPRTIWYGHHPVQVYGRPYREAPELFCWIKGPHYHAYGPPGKPEYRQEDGAVFFMGPIPVAVAQERSKREEVLELEYRPYVDLRPRVVVAPPLGWLGTVWVVGAPGVQVIIPGVVPVQVKVKPKYYKVKHDNGKHNGWYGGYHDGKGHGDKHGHGNKGNGKGKGHD